MTTYNKQFKDLNLPAIIMKKLILNYKTLLLTLTKIIGNRRIGIQVDRNNIK